jgi:hypothetical protein
MARLEGVARPLLAPMMRNAGRMQLDPAAQKRHRAWTTKTALLFGDWIRSYKQPPDGVWAWLFAVNAHPDGRLATSFGGWFAGYDGRADAYLRTFHVGALGFRALGVTHNREVTTAPPRSPSGLRARPGADLAPPRRQLAGRRLGRSAWGTSRCSPSGQRPRSGSSVTSPEITCGPRVPDCVPAAVGAIPDRGKVSLRERKDRRRALLCVPM